MVLVNDRLEVLDLEGALEGISPERRAKALGYRFELDRRLSVAAYLLLKEALRRAYGIVGNPRLSVASDGKPFLTDYPGIHFNLSHCPKAAACVVADSPVGIDVEQVAPIDWAVAERVLAAAELEAVRHAVDPDVKFAEFWTKKEALVKLLGEGLNEALLPDLLSIHAEISIHTQVAVDRSYVLSVARFADAVTAERFGK